LTELSHLFEYFAIYFSEVLMCAHFSDTFLSLLKIFDQQMFIFRRKSHW